MLFPKFKNVTIFRKIILLLFYSYAFEGGGGLQKEAVLYACENDKKNE